MSCRILISDTQVASRRMLRFAMDMKKCEVLECADLDETMAMLAAHRVDLLLVSLYPWDSEGYSVLEQIHERFKQNPLPVLLIGDTVLRAGFDVYRWRGTAWLDRPFRVSELMNLVDSILSFPAGHPGPGKVLAG